MNKIYIVEDDDNIRELLIYTLQTQGMEAEGFALPSEFWKAMEKKMPNLLLLDIMLPQEDGLSILKKIRMSSRTKKLPVIMLTAKGSEYDTVLGLDSSADELYTKAIPHDGTPVAYPCAASQIPVRGRDHGV